MRPKTLHYVITFFTTADAMAVEKRCKQQSVPGRLIPVPTRITSSCGMAWSLPLDAKMNFDTAVSGIEIEGCYEMLI